MSARELLAYVDESLSDSKRDPGVYILAAGIAEPADLDHTRSTLEGLRLKGQRKLHWRDESDKRQRLIVEAIDELPLAHLIIVREDQPSTRPERRRRLCMERLLFELDQMQVATVTFESRGPADDRRDRHMLDSLRARKTIGSSLRLTHEKGPLEPMLWIPDALCGAATSQRVGDAPYLDQVRSVQVINV